MRVLALNPYHGGSHKNFLAGWIAHSRHEWTLKTLPARHFKWRIRQASIGLADQARSLIDQGKDFDVVFTTSLVDAAELRGLLPSEYRCLPLVVYFHENQLIYPTRKTDARDAHFSLINWASALAADAAWFNSEFNRMSLIDGLRSLLRKMPDERSLDSLEGLSARSSVEALGLYPGALTKKDAGPLHVGWVARWEHDKRPDLFFQALKELKDAEVPFRLSCLGEQFRVQPPEFDLARSSFGDSIVQFGFLPNREAYEAALGHIDVVVSTAEHEFFGLSMMEAVGRGAVPLAPNTLVYPELYPKSCLYEVDGEKVSERLTKLAQMKDQDGDLLQLHQSLGLEDIAQKYCWTRRAPALDEALAQATCR